MATKKKRLFDSIKQGAGGALSGHEKEWTAPAAPKRQTQGDGRGTGSQTTSAGRSSGTSSTSNGLEILQAAQMALNAAPNNNAPLQTLSLDTGAIDAQRKQAQQAAKARSSEPRLKVTGTEKETGKTQKDRTTHKTVESTKGWTLGEIIQDPVGAASVFAEGAVDSLDDALKPILHPDEARAEAEQRLARNQRMGAAAKGKDGVSLVDMTDKAGWNTLGTVTGALDMTLGSIPRAFGKDDNIFHRWNEAVQANVRANQEYFDKKLENSSKVKRFLEGEAIPGLVELLPDMMLAYRTGGLSLALGGAPRTGVALGRQKMTELLCNPVFWSAFTREAGSGYNEQLNKGKTEDEAARFAIMNGFASAMIEMGGGVQTLPGEMQAAEKALPTLLKSGLEEAYEEPTQNALAQFNENLLLGEKNPFFSTTDENAIINPKRAGHEALLAGTIGLMAGAPSAVSRGAQNVQERRQNRAQAEARAEEAAPATGGAPISAGLQTLQNAAESLRTNGTAQEGNFTEKAETALGQTRTGQIGAEERIATAQAPRNDSAGETFAPEDHIDNRTDDYIRKTGTKAFQHEHPELHDNFVAVATEMQALLHASVESDLPGKKGGTIAWYPEPIKKLVNGTGLSRPKLMGVLQDIIDNHGTENYADAKRVEKVLDELLTKGYEGYGRRRVPPDDTYLAKKDAINGAKDRNSFDAFMDENWMRTLEGDTEETLRAEWEAKQLKTQLEERIGRPLTNADLDSMSNQELAERIRPAMEQDVPTDANGLPLGQGAASAGFDPYSAWQNESDSFHREGEKAARPVELPTENRDGLRTMKGGQTVMEAEQTPTERADQLAGVYVDGGLAYAPVKNAELAASAETKLERDGWEKTLRDWTADVRSGKLNNDIVAMGAVLINQAGNSGMDAKSYLDLASDYVVLTHRAGQALQASRILKNLTPSARLYMMQRSIYSIAEEAGIDDAEINPELAEKYMKAETDKERDAVIGEIQADIASRLKSTAMDKWTALRYTNMLGNFKTQVCNLTGNTIMGLEAAIRRRLDAALGGAAHVVTGGKHQREVSAFYAPSLYSAAWSDFENVKSYAKGESKFSDINSPFQANEFLRGINDKKRIFKFAPLEGYRKLTKLAMEAGDDIFIRLTYADAMAQYLNAHGVKDGAALRGGEVSEDLLYAAREYAAREAQEATFHDTNAFSGWVSQIGRGKNTPKFVKTAVEGTLPFRKTPANVAVRGYEYSPLGVASSLLNTVNAINPNSETTANDAIRSWSKTMTGSALLVAGFTLARMGVLRGKDDDDEKKAAFDHLRGHQEYSIEIGGKSYTIDAFAPSCMPLLVGAEAARLTRDNGWDVKNVESALANLTDPMINMSMLQGVNDTLDNIKFADNSMIQLAELSIFNYLTQGTTNTLAGQLERTFEPNRMTTYTDPDSPLPAWMQKQIGKMSAKTPGWDYQQTEYLDSWGRTQSNGTLGQRAVRNLFAPWYTSELSDDSVENELERLYNDTGNSSLLPDAYAPNDMTFDGKQRKATQGEKESYQARAGDAAHSRLEKLFSTSEYLKMRDDERAAAIAAIYDYAQAKGKSAAGADYSDPEWMDKSEGSVEKNAAFYGILQAAKQRLDADERDKNAYIMQQIARRKLGDKDTEQVFRQLLGEDSGTLKMAQKFRGEGMSYQDFTRHYANLYDSKQKVDEDDQGKNASVMMQVLKDTKSDRQAMTEFRMILGDESSTYSKIETLYKEHIPLRQIVGYYNACNEDYAYNPETGKYRKRRKAEKIQWLMDTYGYSQAQAYHMYKVFAG